MCKEVNRNTVIIAHVRLRVTLRATQVGIQVVNYLDVRVLQTIGDLFTKVSPFFQGRKVAYIPQPPL